MQPIDIVERGQTTYKSYLKTVSPRIQRLRTWSGVTSLNRCGAAVTVLIMCALAALAQPLTQQWDAAANANPILPGYYADPSILQHQGKYFLYATLDPWGGQTLGCWESSDFKHWTYRALNWPTKQACQSPTSTGAMVWAPSVVKARNGRFYMYVSVGSEVWVGVAEHPLGPWRNALGDQPLIPATWNRRYHMIDAECFIDDDGSAYLYWGSGWDWKNGHCFVVKLKPDMVTFDGAARDVTPDHYFEAPFMFKHAGRYFLTYSNGKTISDTYQVHYASGHSPLGPFTEASNSPILVTAHERNIVSPGHHAVFRERGKAYILYHRHRVPFKEGEAFRQMCVDELVLRPNGLIEKVRPTHRGPALAQRRASSGNLATPGAVITASSTHSEHHRPARVLDNNYATRWAASPAAAGGWLQLDLGAVKQIKRNILRFEYAWKDYPVALEASTDGKTWRMLADYRPRGVNGSPVVIEQAATCRYLRLVFPEHLEGASISLIEWQVF